MQPLREMSTDRAIVGVMGADARIAVDFNEVRARYGSIRTSRLMGRGKAGGVPMGRAPMRNDTAFGNFVAVVRAPFNNVSFANVSFVSTVRRTRMAAAKMRRAIMRRVPRLAIGMVVAMPRRAGERAACEVDE